MSEITEKEYQRARKIVEQYNKQKQLKKDKIISSCKHLNQDTEISEWHQNGSPDRCRTFCKDCGKTLSS